MFVDIGLKFNAVPSQPTWVTLRSRSCAIDFDRFSGKAHVRRAMLSCDRNREEIFILICNIQGKLTYLTGLKEKHIAIRKLENVIQLSLKLKLLLSLKKNNTFL